MDSINLKEIIEVKAVPPDSKSTELTDLLITGLNTDGEEVFIRIERYTSNEGGYTKFQAFYESDS